MRFLVFVSLIVLASVVLSAPIAMDASAVTPDSCSNCKDPNSKLVFVGGQERITWGMPYFVSDNIKSYVTVPGEGYSWYKIKSSEIRNDIIPAFQLFSSSSTPKTVKYTIQVEAFTKQGERIYLERDNSRGTIWNSAIPYTDTLPPIKKGIPADSVINYKIKVTSYR